MKLEYPPAPNRCAPFFIELDKAAHSINPPRPVIRWAELDEQEQAAKSAIIQPVEKSAVIVRVRRPINRAEVDRVTIRETVRDYRSGMNTDSAADYLRLRGK